MSHIDEALKRASEQAAARAAPSGKDQGGIPSADVFESPWEFQADVRPAERAGGNGSGAVPAVAGAKGSAPPAPMPEPSLPAERKGEGFAGNRALAERLAATGQMSPRSFEQYRRLAATLHHAQLEKSIRVVMVTSAVAGEGKTLTATNVALTLAESYGRNTLLIDADLRRPAVHELFAVPNVSGLSDGLRATAEQKLSLQRVSPRLSLLTAGRPDQDPAGLLTSESMRRVVEEAAAAFDWVVIDTPPVGLLADAKLLAAMVDTVLFVVHAASTPYPVVQRAIEAMGRERVMGIVLNQVEVEGRLGQDKYYHYYYGHEKKRR